MVHDWCVGDEVNDAIVSPQQSVQIFLPFFQDEGSLQVPECLD